MAHLYSSANHNGGNDRGFGNRVEFFLRGELTSRFLAKAATVIVISRAVLWYYLGELNGPVSDAKSSTHLRELGPRPVQASQSRFPETVIALPIPRRLTRSFLRDPSTCVLQCSRQASFALPNLIFTTRERVFLWAHTRSESRARGPFARLSQTPDRFRGFRHLP